MIVDGHQHYVSEDAYPACAPDYVDRLIAALDRRGWQYACVSGIGPAYHGRGNDEVACAVERFPDRIVGMGHLDPDRQQPGIVGELKNMGMRGLKVIGTLKRYDNDAYLPFYEQAATHGLPILFHTGFLGGEPAAGLRDESSDRYRPMTLDRIARLFPDLVLIAAHLGTMLWYQEALAVMTHPNVYGDTSGGPGDTPAAFYRLPLNDRIQWDKLIFGTDSLPDDGHIPLAHLTRLMKELQLPPATRQAVLGGTAARIFALT